MGRNKKRLPMISKSKNNGQNLNSKNRKNHKTKRNALNSTLVNDNVNNSSSESVANTESVNPKGCKKPSQRNLTKYPFHYITPSLQSSPLLATPKMSICNPAEPSLLSQSVQVSPPLFNVSPPPPP